MNPPVTKPAGTYTSHTPYEIRVAPSTESASV